MKKRGHIGVYLDGLINERRWHQTDLADKSGVSVAYISEVMRGGKGLGVNSIEPIAAALATNKRERVSIANRLHYLAATFAGFYVCERKD